MKENVRGTDLAWNLWGALLLALIAGAIAVYGQSRPVFSGTWVVEDVELPERPAGGGVGRRGGRMGAVLAPRPEKGQQVRIKQTADRLIVTVPAEDGERMITYALDGSESANAGPRGIVKSKTRWDGVALVTEGTQTIEGPRGEMTLKTREIRSVSDDGRSMIVRTTVDTPRGQMTTTVTYAKRGE